MKTQTSAKHFFLHTGAIVSFYASIIALILLLFRVINVAYPPVMRTAVYYGSSSISFQVATLIVAFPLFLGLSWILEKSYAADSSLTESSLRKWLSYITLFIAGAIVAGDLVTIIYMYLDGRELTNGFLLKFLTLIVIAGGVFAYYLRNIRGVIGVGERNAWRIISSLFMLGSIVLGFAVVGSPAAQRAIRHDQERLANLQSIQWQVVNFYQSKGYIPSQLSELSDPISGFTAPVDPVTGEPYEYMLIGQSAKAFELCAIFDRQSPGNGEAPSLAYPMYGSEMMKGENWDHPAGHYCFERAIDSDLYPVKSLR